MNNRSLVLPSLCLALVLSLAACTAKPGEALRASHPRIVLLTDESGIGLIKKLPPGAEVLGFSASGKEGLSDQVGRLLGKGGVAALIVCPAPESSVGAFLQARQISPQTLLYAGQSKGDPLLLESAADLVAEVVPASEVPDLSCGLAELARRAIPGKVKSDNLEEFLAALRAAAPGRGWTGAYAKDPDTGIKARNHVIVSPSSRG